MGIQGRRAGVLVGLVSLGVFSTMSCGADATPLAADPLDGSGGGVVRPLMFDQPIANPAQAARENAPQTQPSDLQMTHPWELPPVEVSGQRVPTLREDQRVGAYGQPVWTTDRRFAEERVYVIPQGSLQFETWFIPTVNRHGPTEFENQNELEFGLGSRFQVDLYLNRRWVGSGGPTYNDLAFELRYALADWGKIWGNPTLYFEYAKQDQAPDVIEFRLLLGGDIAPGLHWGTNLNYEHETGEQMTNQYELTAGVSYTLSDNRFDIGGELKYNETDTHDHRGTFTDNLFIGPSIQFRPLARAHIDIVPLIGLTHETPALQLYAILGWQF